MNDKVEDLVGEIRNITYRNRDNGWTVLRIYLDKKKDVFTATGFLSHTEVGERIQLQGFWVDHKTYGVQFQFSKASLYIPTTISGIKRYLIGKIEGVGEKLATDIAEHFGDDTIQILNQTPYRLLEIPKIGKKKLKAIVSSWDKSQKHRNSELFLSTYDISPKLAAKIIKTYGSQTQKLITNNPYRLAFEIHGVGFLTADKIAANLGMSKSSPERIKAAIIFILRKGSDQGHCYLETNLLAEELAKLLHLPEKEIDTMLPTCLKELENAGYIAIEKNRSQPSSQRVYPIELYDAEEIVSHLISQGIKKRANIDPERTSEWLSKYNSALGMNLSQNQLEAVTCITESKYLILTGGPGVGKTTTANVIIRFLKAVGHDVALAAPTGRAAKRLSEVAAINAKTIHRLLEWNPQEGTFQRNDTNPLPASALVIDEASMLDVKLTASLLLAIKPGTHVVLIGDVDQLPSVGPGNILSDMIRSNVIPTHRLKTIFRQKSNSGIITIAHAINSGSKIDISASIDDECCLIEVPDVNEIVKTIDKLLQEELPKKGFHPVKDIQILSPMKKGEVGTTALNALAQEKLNPPSPKKREMTRESVTFREGDKVIQNNNNYELGVFNGDIGYILQAGVDDGSLMIDFGEDRTIKYSGENIRDLQLAYAITIHKSQGSEFPAVIIPVTKQHFVMLQRNLYYTGLTRAKKKAIFIGDKAALNMAVKNTKSKTRKTGLVKKIIEQVKENDTSLLH